MDQRKTPEAITISGDHPPLPKAQDACLIMLYGPELGKRFPLSIGPLLIGRSEHADIYIDRDSVSRHHARISPAHESYAITDLDSTNGTYVNDVPIQEVPLSDGDIIKIGEVIFKFLSRENLENVLHEELYKLATTDGLTMAYNKRFFMDFFERELSRSRRYKRHLALMLLDIDFFKRINDGYGHLAGDHVLKRVSRLLQSHTRREDVFARYGGEEFALLLPETDRSQALQQAERLRALVENQEIVFEQKQIRVTLSIGVAVAHADIQKTQELLQEADSYLYHAKNSGRNRVCG